MEGGSAMDPIITAITGMATTVQTAGLDMLAAILPVLAVVIAAFLIAKKGSRLVQSLFGSR